mgnify:CR=1 FL=1
MQLCHSFFFFQAEDGIRDLVRSRGLGDVYKRQRSWWPVVSSTSGRAAQTATAPVHPGRPKLRQGAPCVRSERELSGLAGRHPGCLLYTSDAADERSSVDLGGRRIIQKKKRKQTKS